MSIRRNWFIHFSCFVFLKDLITINVKIDQTGTKIVVNRDKGLKNLCSQRHL